MLAIYLGNNVAKIVKAKKIGKTLKINDALSIPLNDPLVSLNKALYQGLSKAKIVDDEVTFVLDNNSCFIKALIVDKEEQGSLREYVLQKMDKLLITTNEYAIDYSVVGEVDVMGRKKLAVLVGCLSYENVFWYQDLAFALGLNPVSIDISSNVVSKSIQLYDEYIGNNKYYIWLNTQDDYIGLSLYCDDTILLNRYVKLIGNENIEAEVLDNISLLLQFGTRVSSEGVKNVYYTSGKFSTTNIINNVISTLGLNVVKIEQPKIISAPANFTFKEYTNLYGAFFGSAKSDINLLEVFLNSKNSCEFQITLDMRMPYDNVKDFMAKVEDNVKMSNGLVQKLKINSLKKNFEI